MHTETEHLKSIAEDIAARQNPDAIVEPKADHRLLYEVNQLERSITQTLRSIDNITQRDTFHNDVLGKLIFICDILYAPHQRITPDTQVLLDLLSNIRKVVPGQTNPMLPLPKAFIHEQREINKVQWQEFEDSLHIQEIDKSLVAIAALPFQRFIDAKDKLYWGDYTWLKGYAAKLNAADWEHADCNSKAEALMSLLIGRDFNHDQFYVYCKKYIQRRVANIGTKQGRLQEYAICKKLVLEDTEIGLPSFDRHANALSARLLKWIKEEIEAIKILEYAQNEFGKIEYTWDVDTISLYYKYLMDKGITKKINTEQYARQIAATVSSKGKEDFQWDTVHKRLYNKDEKYLKRIFEPLNTILEDIKFFIRKKP